MAKVSSLSCTRLKEVLSYDPDTGFFTFRLKRVGAGGIKHPGDRAGSIRPDGYRSICVDGVTLLAHRAAVFYMTGKHAPVKTEVDHLNGERDDNRWANLRVASNAENRHNQRKPRQLVAGSKRKYLGVSWHSQKDKWRARIMVEGVEKHLGLFDSQEEAYAAYLAAKRIMHSGNTL